LTAIGHLMCIPIWRFCDIWSMYLEIFVQVGISNTTRWCVNFNHCIYLSMRWPCMSDILFEENICVFLVISPFLRWWEKCLSYRWVIMVVCEDEWMHRQTDNCFVCYLFHWLVIKSTNVNEILKESFCSTFACLSYGCVIVCTY
jgi:hypothetical protein